MTRDALRIVSLRILEEGKSYLLTGPGALAGHNRRMGPGQKRI